MSQAMSPEEKMALACSKAGESRAREYLSQYNRMDSRVALELAQLDAIRERAAGMAHRMEALPAASPGDRVAAAAAEAADLEKELLADYNALLRKQREIRETLRSLPEGLTKMTLEMRYLQGMHFFRIAMALHVEERHVYRLHRQGLRRVALILLDSEGLEGNVESVI